MCGTFAILSPDLFTYVYSRIPPGREREFIQKDDGRRDVPAKRVGGGGRETGEARGYAEEERRVGRGG